MGSLPSQERLTDELVLTKAFANTIPLLQHLSEDSIIRHSGKTVSLESEKYPGRIISEFPGTSISSASLSLNKEPTLLSNTQGTLLPSILKELLATSITQQLFDKKSFPSITGSFVSATTKL